MPSQQTFIEHLKELRRRLFVSLCALVGGMVIGLVFCKKIFAVLQIPMQHALPPGSFFIATHPFESYSAYFKVAFVFGLFLASPVIFHQIWKFASPGLAPKERKLILPFAWISAFFFAGGATFGYFIVFPAGFYYVNLILEDTAIRFLPSMNDYLGVATTLLLAFGVTFELPLMVLLLGKLGLVTYQHIKQYRRYVIVVIFIGAAMLTPGPDILSQCLLAIPLWILYELGGLGLILIGRKTQSI